MAILSHMADQTGMVLGPVIGDWSGSSRKPRIKVLPRETTFDWLIRLTNPPLIVLREVNQPNGNQKSGLNTKWKTALRHFAQHALQARFGIKSNQCPNLMKDPLSESVESARTGQKRILQVGFGARPYYFGNHEADNFVRSAGPPLKKYDYQRFEKQRWCGVFFKQFQ